MRVRQQGRLIQPWWHGGVVGMTLQTLNTYQWTTVMQPYLTGDASIGLYHSYLLWLRVEAVGPAYCPAPA